MEASEDRNDKKKRDEDELDFIRAIELRRRTNILMEKESLSREDARNKAAKWILSETGQKQLPLPLESPVKNVYRVYYRRFGDKRGSDYWLLDAVVNGVLYDWVSTHTILAEIIRDRLDPKCETVVTFHLTREHEHDIDVNSEEELKQQDELARRRKIMELEKQIDDLRNQK